ncbi:MAG: hypothetical protein FJ267_18750 [Planctomycetes bacterium]|nr:hypothetical protein [Planctomycetota bacterium]
MRLVDLLKSIGWKSIEGRGDQLRGPCPLPACISRTANNSKQTRGSFSVHAGKNVYQCFRCGSKGNVVAFWQAYRCKSHHESAIELVHYAETGNHTIDAKEPPKP